MSIVLKCDQCGIVDDTVAKFYLPYDRITDSAGARVDNAVELDLCAKCYRNIMSRAISHALRHNSFDVYKLGRLIREMVQNERQESA